MSELYEKNHHLCMGKINTLFAMFMLIFLSSGLLITNDIISSSATIALWIVLLLSLLTNLKSINKKSIYLTAALLCNVWLTVIARGENIRNAVMLTFAFLVAMVFVNTYRFLAFKKAYLSVMYALCVISLIGFVLFNFFPELHNYSVIVNKAGYKYTNFFIYVHSHHVNRNLSIFWEPGAFQTYIGLALLLELLNDNPRIGRVLVFLISIITTFSTTGYLAVALILMMMLLTKKQIGRRMKAFTVIVCVALLVVFMLSKDTLFSTSSSSPFGKLVHFFNTEAYRDKGKSTSATIRFWGVVKPIQVFFESPLWGWGYEGLQAKLYEYTKGMNTCTFVNWFAVYGILYGSILLTGMIKLSKKLTQSSLTALMILAILFTLTMSENYVNNSSIIILALYGHMPKGENA